ncbi:MAG: methyltransferase domain-containing protein [Caldilineaceae bacterium]
MTELWHLDEVSHAGQEHLDTAYVAGYDRKAQFDPTADIQHLVGFGLSTESNVIDFGAGTGSFALAVAPLCHTVFAVDPSPAMVAYLHAAVAQSGVENVTVVQGGFLSYQHHAAPVDFIFTRNALHHLPDFWKVQALAKLHALLAPHGILRLRDLFYDFEPTETEEKLQAWFAGAVADAAEGWTAAELAEHVRLEHSTFSWLFEQMLARTGFEVIDRTYQREIYGAYSCRVSDW